MKILTTLSYYKPHISGLTVCVQRLIDGLSKKDFKFTVLTSCYRNNLLKSETENSVKIIHSPVLFTFGKVPIMPWYLFQAIREIRNNNLVWINLPQAEGLAVAVTSKLLGKKIITTVHCLPLLPNGWQRLLFQRLFDLFNNLVIRLADKVVYYTKDYAENTKELLHIPSKSSYILPPIPNEGRRLRAEGRRKIDRLMIGFAGRIAEDKGIEYLVEAVRLLEKNGTKIKLLIVGSKNAVGESRYSKKINDLIGVSGIEVEFLGEIDPKNMFEFYRKIDLLVLPSVNRTEAFGIVQVEAMRYGVPVVSSDLPGVRVPIQLTGSGRLIPVGNVAVLERAMNEMLVGIWDRKDIISQAKKCFELQESLSNYECVFQQTKNRFKEY